MKTFAAFVRKEWMELVRSGRLTILLIVFSLLGIMNPAIAKLTPWMMEMMAETLKDSGLTVTNVTVNALTSWTQFFKNLPLGLIVFVLIKGNLFTKEYQSGTLIPVLTKGLARHKVLAAKALMMLLMWSICFWMCFGITYSYNAYFWDNGIARHLWFACTCQWLVGVLVVALMVLFSSICSTGTGVLLGTAGAYVAAYLVSLFPKVDMYSPAYLMNSGTLLNGVGEPGDYVKAIAVTVALVVACTLVSVKVMDRRRV